MSTKLRPIIFARVADMLYYKGVTDIDTPVNGGSYVNQTGSAGEAANFGTFINEEGKGICLGFVMIANSGKNGVPQIHIEKVIGCEELKNQDRIEDAIVVFCSTSRGCKNMRVVGFYKHAVVYRYMQEAECFDEEGSYWHAFNFEAKKEDCVLLPKQERHSNSKWYIPTSHRNGSDFGFGRANIWLASHTSCNEKEREFVSKMIESIESYNGENWIDKGVA